MELTKNNLVYIDGIIYEVVSIEKINNEFITTCVSICGKFKHQIKQ